MAFYSLSGYGCFCFSLGLSSFLGSSIQSQKKIQQFTTERVFKQGDGSLGGRDFLGEGYVLALVEGSLREGSLMLGRKLLGRRRSSYSPPQVDRRWPWVRYNKIPIYPIFYLLKGDSIIIRVFGL